MLLDPKDNEELHRILVWVIALTLMLVILGIAICHGQFH